MTVNLIHPDLLDTVALLRGVAETLAEQRRLTDHQVDVLLDGGWSGRAARDYREGWQQWRAGCDEVVAALLVMGDLVAGARTELVEQDELVRSGLVALAGGLHGRLPGRLG